MIMLSHHQRAHWEDVYAKEPGKFGPIASVAAQLAVPLYRERRVTRLLELGCGPGRDATYFASLGFCVTALDYAQGATAALERRARLIGLGEYVTAVRHDLREPLPFATGSFDACYSHMALCMEFCDAELRDVVAEIHRVLRREGMNVYTVRATSDPDCGHGTAVSEGVYEVEGYAIRFFDLAKIEELTKASDAIQVRSLTEGAKRLWWVAEVPHSN
jgi:SAM-dependent methyltransferase